MLHVLVALQAFALSLRDRVDTKAEDGATAVEYGLMVALIAIVIIAAVTAVGTSLETVFNNIAGALGFVAGP